MALSDVKGTIFDIQHYSIHDGPGIRVNVFLKGCPLRCLWCQNPESQSSMPQLMYRADKCSGCGRCIEACPHGCIVRSEDKVQTTECRACGMCVSVCPNEARNISGYEANAGDVVKEVLADRIFMDRDGGITVTGGEPLMQPEFSKALLALAKEAGISTAVESCGFADWEKAKSVFTEADYILYDVKHMDAGQHVKCTGVSNELILQNLKKINDELDAVIHVRTPIVPGYNDSFENIHSMGRFIKENITRCRKVSLLPYHPMGESKKEQLIKASKAFRVSRPSEEKMEELRDILRTYGLEVN